MTTTIAQRKRVKSSAKKHVVKKRVHPVSPSELAVRTPINEIVSKLRDVLGSAVISALTELDVRNVQRWIDSSSVPQDEAQAKLRTAFTAVGLISEVDEAPVVRAWFIGMNDQLDDYSPAEAIAEGKLREVMAAARAFVSNG